MIPASSQKASMRPLTTGRLGRLLQRQEESNERLASDPLLTPRFVRSILGISYSGLNRLITEKKLAVWQIGHGHRRIRTSELNRFLASGDPPTVEDSAHV